MGWWKLGHLSCSFVRRCIVISQKLLLLADAALLSTLSTNLPVCVCSHRKLLNNLLTIEYLITNGSMFQLEFNVFLVEGSSLSSFVWHVQ